MLVIFANLATCVALGLAALLAIYFLLVGFGLLRLRQTSSPTTNQFVQEIFERGQQIEYESLIALDFIPLGKYQDGFGPVDRTANGFAFGHPTLPVSCLLCQHTSGIITKHMLSDDGQGRMIFSGDHNALIDGCDERSMFVQVDSIATVERIFRAHLTAVDVWEADGFDPVQVSTLQDFEWQSKRYWGNLSVREALLKIALLGPIGIMLTHVVAPAVIAAGIFFFSAGTQFELSLPAAKCIFAGLSMLIFTKTFVSLNKFANGKLRKQPAPKATGKGFGHLPTAIGLVDFEFANQAWGKRIQRHRWALYVSALIVFSCFPPFLILVAVTMLTRFKRVFAIKRKVSFNANGLMLQTTSFVGTWKSRIPFANIDGIQLEELGEHSFRIVGHYQPKLPFEPNARFLGLSISPMAKATNGREFVVVDSLWGYNSEKIRTLHHALKEKQQLASAG